MPELAKQQISNCDARQISEGVEFVLSKLQVLIIDDSKFSRKIIGNSLATLGVFNHRDAKDAVEAIEILQNDGGGINLIIVDNDMPIMSGAEFTKHIRRSGDVINCDVPVIMISALTDQHHVSEARDSGVHEFLAKPFSPDSLRAHIISALDPDRKIVRDKGYVGPERRVETAAIDADSDRRSPVMA